MWPLRVSVFLSPLILFTWLAPPAAWDSTAQFVEHFIGWSYLMRRLSFWSGGRLLWPLFWAGLMALADYYAKRSRRNEITTIAAMVVLPLVTPVILALLPLDPYLTYSNWRSGMPGALGFGKSAHGSFEDRFPLLIQSLAGQPEATRAGMKALFRGVRVNFEFLLGAHPSAVARLLAEAKNCGFVTWTGVSGNAPLVYGAGMVRPKAVEDTVRWLAAAGAPGQKLMIAFRDEAGLPQFREQRCGTVAGAGA
jgi:hypothetical protein